VGNFIQLSELSPLSLELSLSPKCKNLVFDRMCKPNSHHQIRKLMSKNIKNDAILTKNGSFYGKYKFP